MVFEKETFECGLCFKNKTKWELYECSKCKITFCRECFQKGELYLTNPLSECQEVLTIVCPRAKEGKGCIVISPVYYFGSDGDY